MTSQPAVSWEPSVPNDAKPAFVFVALSVFASYRCGASDLNMGRTLLASIRKDNAESGCNRLLMGARI